MELGLPEQDHHGLSSILNQFAFSTVRTSARKSTALISPRNATKQNLVLLFSCNPSAEAIVENELVQDVANVLT